MFKEWLLQAGGRPSSHAYAKLVAVCDAAGEVGVMGHEASIFHLIQSTMASRFRRRSGGWIGRPACAGRVNCSMPLNF